MCVLVSTFACKSRDFNQESETQNVDAQTVRFGEVQNIKANKIEFGMETELFIHTINTKESDQNKINWTRVEADGMIQYTLDLPSSANPTSQFTCKRPSPKPGVFTATKCLLTFNNGSGREVEGQPCFYTSEESKQPEGKVNCGFKRGERPIAHNAEGKAVFIDRILFTGEEAMALYKSIKFNGAGQRTKGTSPDEKPEHFLTANWIECQVIPDPKAPGTKAPTLVNCALNASTGI